MSTHTGNKKKWKVTRVGITISLSFHRIARQLRISLMAGGRAAASDYVGSGECHRFLQIDFHA